MAVVVPLIASQAERLKTSMSRWGSDQFFPCSNSSYFRSIPRIPLVFYFDRPLDEETTAAAVLELQSFLASNSTASAIRTCFGDVSYRSARLSARESTNSYWMDIVHNLVQTRGSNAQFHAAFQVLSGGRYRHMFYMEPDTWPVRANWLEAVHNESTWGGFWMRGTVMQYPPKFNIGVEPFRTQYQRHMNGNSIYKLDDPCFDKYRELTRNYYGNGAFDVAMTMYRLSMRRIRTFQAIAHRFQASNVIADLGVTWFSEAELVSSLPDTYLAHAKFMYVKHPGMNFMQYR